MKKVFLVFGILFFTIISYSQVKNEKRGIAYGHHSEADMQAISGSLSWWYNWSTGPESTVAGVFEEYNMDFVPMTWNANFNDSLLNDYYKKHPNAKYLLGFNEPNFLDQANMTPSRAAAEWHRLEAIADSNGLELVSPAVNWCGQCVTEDGVTFTDPYEYLDSFFAACVDCKVDYIAVHNYMSAPGALIDYLENFKKYGKKIWLTEFAAWDAATDLDAQKSLMLGALDYLDNDTMIFRYSWFIGRWNSNSPPISLFESESGVLSELGELYTTYNPIHDTTVYVPVPARIEAESYSKMSGVSIEGTSDFDGLANVGWIDAGDWLEYNIDAADTTEYYLYLRIAANATTSVQVLVDDELLSTVEILSTGGWQNWETIKSQIALNKGEAKLKLYAPTGSFNINWLKISTQDNTAPICSVSEDQEIALPISSAKISGDALDVDDDILQYKWEKRSGPSSYNIFSADSDTTTVDELTQGIYTFKFTVSDGFETCSDNVKVTVIDNSSGLSSISNQELIVYPNPVENTLIVKIPEGDGAINLIVYSVSGEVVVNEKFETISGEAEIDFSLFERGLYIVKLEMNNKVFITKVAK